MKDRKPWIIAAIILALLAIPYITRSEENQLKTIAVREEEVMTDDTNTDTDTVTQDEPVQEKEKNIPDDAIGTIEIPSLDLRYPIYEGADEAQLCRGIGHLPETASLLEKGNCVCCGHNGSSSGVFFTNLSHIRKGAQVTIETKDHRTHIYSVLSTRIVGPHDASVRKKSDTEILTLFTCAYHGARRFVATCEPASDTPEQS